jgi:hypothetical protein
MRLLAAMVTAGGGRLPLDDRRLPDRRHRAQAADGVGYGPGVREPPGLSRTGREHEAADRDLVNGSHCLPP